MATVKPNYAGSASFTITLNSLAHAAARESTAIDNTTNLYADALVTVTCKLASGTPGSDKAIYVYAYGSEDGTNYGDNVTGSDAGVTLRNNTNLRLVGVITTPDAGALTYKSHPIPIAAAFGGVLPRKWGIVTLNMTNVTFDSSGCSATYTGLNLVIV